MAPHATKIGFIGLGLMGKPMAGHLAQAGFDVIVHNRSRMAVDELVSQGCRAAESPIEVARDVGDGVVILMLTNTAAVRDVIEGDNGLLAGTHPGLTIVDMGSTKLDETRRWRQLLVDRGGDWVDAPVSGGQRGAIDATLTIFAGGDRDRVTSVRPILQHLGNTVTYLGPTGCGQMIKLANQIMVAVSIASVSEAFLMCQRAGVDMKAAREALMGGFAASKILDQHGQRMIEGDYLPGGRASNQLKDVREACRLADQQNLDLPMLATNRQLWEAMVEAGLGDLDHAGLFQWYQQRFQETGEPSCES